MYGTQYGTSRPYGYSTSQPTPTATGPNPWRQPADTRKLAMFAGGALLLFLLLK